MLKINFQWLINMYQVFIQSTYYTVFKEAYYYIKNSYKL